MNKENTNLSYNLNYLLDCCNIIYTQQEYQTGVTIPRCNISLSTLKKARAGKEEPSEKTKAQIAVAFSLLQVPSASNTLSQKDLDLPNEEFRQKFPASDFTHISKKYPYPNMHLFSNKLYRCYYMMPSSPYKVYMGYFKLFAKNNIYRAYMIRGISAPDPEELIELDKTIREKFEHPESLHDYVGNFKAINKKSESIHLYEARNDEAGFCIREDITFTCNRIKIDFRSTENDPCYSTMLWNICIPNGLNLNTYIGGSALILDTNDGTRGKNISAFKMGLEALEKIPQSQKEIIEKGPLAQSSERVCRELTLHTVDGVMTLDNSDDNRWFRFIQNDNYRVSNHHPCKDINIEKLTESLLQLKAEYEFQVSDLKNTISELRQQLSK